MRISNCCQCNSIFSLSVNSSFSDDSSKITLRNTGQNILNRKLVAFTKGNKESQGFSQEASRKDGRDPLPPTLGGGCKGGRFLQDAGYREASK